MAWLDGKWVDEQVLALVPAELALKHGCLPLSVTEERGAKVLHLAIQDPGNIEALDEVGFRVGHNVSPVLAGPLSNKSPRASASACTMVLVYRRSSSASTILTVTIGMAFLLGGS